MQKAQTINTTQPQQPSNQNALQQLPQGQMSQTAVQVQPKFLFGHKGDVKNNLFFIDHNLICYPCGHNIVLYKMDDHSQKFIPGIEGSEGIVSMALTANRKQLAVCEKATKAICSIYNVGKMLETLKDKKSGSNNSLDQSIIKKKRLLVSTDYNATAFISCDFCTENDRLIVTLGDDLRIIVWQWDKQKCVASESIQQISATSVLKQISFSNLNPNVIIVTGKDVYKFYNLTENNQLKCAHHNFSRRDENTANPISNNFVCHAWLADGKFIVCTDIGQILLFEANGDYKNVQIFDPKRNSFQINSVLPFTIGQQESQASGNKAPPKKSGFIIAGDSGQFRVFFKSETDVRTPYKRAEGDDLMMTAETERSNPMIYNDVMYHKITNMVLSPREDLLLFTTDSNQVIKIQINLERPYEVDKFEYLVSSFHSKAIYGLDVCIKKQLLATCSNDRTVRIWSYSSHGSQFKLEVSQPFQDEAYSLALHPSGFQMVIGFGECIRMMNILDKTLVPFKNIQIKNCREIQFSHGGQYFACQNASNISVFKFYSGESPSEFYFKGHNNFIKSISWLEDDTGFVTCGWDASIFYWKLYPEKTNDDQNSNSLESKQGMPVWEYKQKNNTFSSVAIFRGEGELEPVVYTTGNDRFIKEITSTGAKSGENRITQAKDTFQYTEGTPYSQIVGSAPRKLMFAGVADQTKPSSIQVFRHTFEQSKDQKKESKDQENKKFLKILDVQAHSKAIERIKLNFDHSKLFTVGADGVVGIFTIHDKETSKKSAAHFPAIQFSEEILIEKKRRDELQSEIQRLNEDIRQERANIDAQTRKEIQQNEDKIKELERHIEEQKRFYDDRNERVDNEMVDVQNAGAGERERLRRLHDEELLAKKREFEEKMYTDNERYQELLHLKDEQEKKFRQKLSELHLLQEKQYKEIRIDHDLQKQEKDKERKELQVKIDKLLSINKEERKAIEDTAWEEIDVIKDKNKEELALIIDAGIASKAKLIEVQGNFKTQKNAKEHLASEIKEKQAKLNELITLFNELKANIQSQELELAEREHTIRDKDKRIYDLKKKTQELEKFKFVLDYKIKELRTDIGPRGDKIESLKIQTDKMKQEEMHFMRVNQNLGLIVEDLRMRQKGLILEQRKLATTLEEQETEIKKFKDDVHEGLNCIGDFKKLKKQIVRLYKIYVKEEFKKKNQDDSDLTKEFQKKRKNLEQNVHHLREAQQKSDESHTEVNKRFMKQNVDLIKQINDLKQEEHSLEKNIRLIQSASQIQEEQEWAQATDEQRELKMQDIQIQQILEEIRQEQLRNIQLKERRPQRLAPLHLRVNNTEMGDGLQESQPQAYNTDQIDDVMDGMVPNNLGDMPEEENQHQPGQHIEAQDDARPSANEMEAAM